MNTSRLQYSTLISVAILASILPVSAQQLLRSADLSARFVASTLSAQQLPGLRNYLDALHQQQRFSGYVLVAEAQWHPTKREVIGSRPLHDASVGYLIPEERLRFSDYDAVPDRFGDQAVHRGDDPGSGHPGSAGDVIDDRPVVSAVPAGIHDHGAAPAGSSKRDPGLQGHTELGDLCRGLPHA